MPDAEGENWYDWRVEHWGTKWEVNDPVFILQDDFDGKMTRLICFFDTAWSPPLDAYEHFLAQDGGCEIEAYYCEPGCQFAGVFINGGHKEICDEEFDAPIEKRSDLWWMIDEHMGLDDIYEMTHEDDEEDEDEVEDEDEEDIWAWRTRMIKRTSK